MRTFWFVILLVLLGAVGAFAYQNNEAVSVRFFDWSLSSTMAVLVGAVYVLGMVSGWTVVGLVRRSVHRVTEPRD